ncbi:disease resistance protein RGA5-like [Triticum dicoccoides]|uniref:disease resistance protein RGA5-like n=1 Tax=Triticum dicoccoides TaxID=85692 RepID=UPI00188FD4A5|nr:disease resistance protein RGA5-like [Triticum dicoccoides]
MAPVVSAAMGTLGPLLGKLTSLLADECGRLKGVRREIRSLKSELTSMHAAVHKYMMLEDPDIQVKSWISLVRELSYDIEDCIDKFIHHLGDGGHDGGFKEFFRTTARRLKTLGSRRTIANQIGDLKARVKEVKELKSSYKLDDVACSTSAHAALDPQLSALFAEEAQLVGVDGPRDDLVNWMVEEGDGSTKHHRRVLSIVGFGGLGKTTLANEVYRKIQENFHCRAFVSVSQKPDIKKIIKDVISQVSFLDGFTKDIDIWDEKKSIAKLREVLQDKRYLIVIDDIWSIPAWDAIKCAFPDNMLSSRIMATTRVLDVARSCCSGWDGRVYEMEPLSDLHSRRLFFKRIFSSKDCCPDILKEVSNEILRKCGGLPLAIISISSLLANRPAVKEEWERVKRSIGSAMDKGKSLEGMNSILSLSYSDLPPNLKTCLLYLSHFPEDSMIERERLVRRWIAEGFICEERGQSQEEIAESYFYELINKSMIQPMYIQYDGKTNYIKIHDMMLELIISKSAEDNFITVVNGEQTVWENDHGYIRRLSIQHIDQDLASILANKDLRHVRSLTVTNSGCVKHLPSLGEFESLRVLDFEGCEGLQEYDMSCIGNLFHLKYLSFRGTGISELPPGIVVLHDLLTLDLELTWIQELPAAIVQLTKLQHLLALVGRRNRGNSWNTTIPNGIGNMRNLRVISGLSTTRSSVGAVEELGKLTCLNQLIVRVDKRHEDMLLSSLCKLGTCKLQSLAIIGDLEFLHSWSPVPSSLRRLHNGMYFLKIPEWIFISNLTYIDIKVDEVTEEDLHMLGKLHALLYLEIIMESKPKQRLTIQGFPSLKEFLFNCFDDGVYITFTEGAMPKLEKFDMMFDVSIAITYAFYTGITHLPYLKEAEVYICSGGAGHSEIKAAGAVIRDEARFHPNHPKVTIFEEGPDGRFRPIA